MGGTRADLVIPIIKDTPLRYFPFPGTVVDHPSRLEGTIEQIVEQAKQLCAQDGVDGLDLLAYRSTGSVGALMTQVCAAVDKPVIVAGSIDTEKRIADVAASGAAAFTVGTGGLRRRLPSGR